MFALLLVACSSFRSGTMATIDGREPPDDDQLPVVVGGTVSLCLLPESDWSRSLEGASLTSEAPQILAADGGICPAILRGVNPGSTRLVLREPDGAERRVFTIDVVRPDAVVLGAVGPRLLRSELPESEARPNILVGSAALFVARAQARGAEPYGVSWLAGETAEGITTSARRGDAETLGRDLVSVWLDPSVAPGPHSASVVVDGRRLPLALNVVAPEAVRSVALEGPHFRPTLLVSFGFVLALGRLADGAPVYGLPVEWALRDGWAQGTGSAFRFTRAPGQSAPLRARWRDLEASIDVEGTGGTVIDPPRMACSTGAPWTTLGALVGLVLVARRRR